MSKYTIKINVKTHYLAQQSDPRYQRFAFAYTIGIENCSAVGTQLLGRHWLITDANNTVEEVVGEGVVGEQPYILPGGTYTYSSHALLKTPSGIMEGKYTMKGDDGQIFDVPIPAFSLVRPESLH